MTVPFMHHHVSKQTGLRDTVVLEGAERWDDKPDGFTQTVFDQSRLQWICVSN